MLAWDHLNECSQAAHALMKLDNAKLNLPLRTARRAWAEMQSELDEILNLEAACVGGARPLAVPAEVPP